LNFFDHNYNFFLWYDLPGRSNCRSFIRPYKFRDGADNRRPGFLDIALVADDRRYGALVAADLERLGRRVNLLDGGFSAWQRTGLPVTSGCELYASEPNDMMFDAGDFDDQAVNFREGRAYLEWEIGLVHQLANDPGAPYAN